MRWPASVDAETVAQGPLDRQVSDSGIAWLLGVSFLAFFTCIQYGHFWGWDGATMANITHNIVDHRSLAATRDVSWWVPEALGRGSVFGIGMSVVFVPFWFIQRYINPQDGFLLTFANPIITAATVAVVYRIGRALRWHRTTAVMTALAFGLLTMAPTYSVELFSEPAVGLCLAVALLGLIRLGQDPTTRPWMLGAAIGATTLFRYESFILVVPVLAAVPLFVDRRRLKDNWPRWLLPLIGPTVAAIAWTLYYNAYRFGSPLTFPNTDRFNHPILEGIQRQLLSPGKGFFWYDPILIAAIPGLALLWRRNRAVVVVVLALFVPRLIYFARFYNPDGSVAWGPRYLVPLCPLLVLGVGEVFERARGLGRRARVWASTTVALLATVSAVVVFASVWVPYSYTWGAINEGIPPTLPPQQAKAVVDARLDRQNYDWYWSPVILNLRRLGDGGHFNPPGFPLRWWRGGPSAVGVISLAGALAGSAAALVVAVRTDKRTKPLSRRVPLPSSSIVYDG
jgi:hypothetical protein